MSTDDCRYENPQDFYSKPQKSRNSSFPGRVLQQSSSPSPKSQRLFAFDDPIVEISPCSSPFRDFVQREKNSRRSSSPAWVQPRCSSETSSPFSSPIAAERFRKSQSEPCPVVVHRAQVPLLQNVLSTTSEFTPTASPVLSARCCEAVKQAPILCDAFHAESGDEIFVLDDRNFKPVMNRHGEVAFVPERIISPTTQRKTPPKLKNASWLMASYFHGHISRQEAEAVLSNKRLEAGAFLLRLKDGEKHVFALSVKVSGSDLIEHHLLQVDERGRDPILVNGKPLISCFTIEEAIEFMASNESRGPLLPHKLRIPVAQRAT